MLNIIKENEKEWGETTVLVGNFLIISNKINIKKQEIHWVMKLERMKYNWLSAQLDTRILCISTVSAPLCLVVFFSMMADRFFHANGQGSSHDLFIVPGLRKIFPAQ